jgi:ribosome-associated protein
MTEDDRPSKTQRKKQMHELQALGARLVSLNDSQLDEIGLAQPLRTAVDDAKRFTRHEARRRQMQYIGRLMRDIDPAPIREKLKIWDGVSQEHTARHHLVERWRERLMEDDGALGELAKQQRGLDTQRLRSLVRSAREEVAAGRPPRNHRELFRFLRQVLESGVAEDGTADAAA